MSKLDEMISKLCPEGVEWKKLGEIGKVSMCKRILKSDTNEIGDIPFYKIGTFGKEPDAYISMDKFVEYKDKYSFPRKGDILISAAGTIGRTVIYDGQPAYYQDSNIVWLAHDESVVLNKYLYYQYQLSPWLIQSGGTIARLYNDNISNAKIPVPPLEVQRKIVHVLDNFTLYQNELTAELTARKKQYEYYRKVLLSESDDMPLIPLKSVIKKSSSGSTPSKTKSEFYEGGTIPWIRTQEVKFNEIFETSGFITEEAVRKTSARWIPENCVIVAISGATAGRCAINKIRATTNQHCLNLQIDENKALYKYVYYCVSNQYEELLSKKQGARGDLNSSLILSLEIPIPSIEEQQRIVDILDRFDKLCNDISKGLPAEIEMRRKQYEYYRDKLLTFKEKKA